MPASGATRKLAVLAELDKIRTAGAAIRAARHALQCRPCAQLLQRAAGGRLPGVRELHIGHAIVSRSVFVGLREAVRRDEAADARGGGEGSMIYGVGTDIVAIARMADVWQRNGEARAAPHAGDVEIVEFAAQSRSGRFLAKRFAAKEALGKALGTGVRDPLLLLRSIAVSHDDLGKPAFAFTPNC
jgi:holo-[acyl-carrier-protein] synthase